MQNETSNDQESKYLKKIMLIIRQNPKRKE